MQHGIRASFVSVLKQTQGPQPPEITVCVSPQETLLNSSMQTT